MLAFVVCAGLGCHDEAIQKYRVAKLDKSTGVDDATTPVSASESSLPASAIESRIVAAIAQRPNASWVFKVVGPPENVASADGGWRAFLEQLTFDENDIPQWKLPEGWTELPGNQFRYKTLMIPNTKPPLELAISRLPPGQDLLMNVNRWRGQLGLDPIQQGELETALKKIPLGNASLLLFDETGKGAGGMSAFMPNARPQQVSDTSASKDDSPSPVDANLPFEFTAPENWEVGPTTQFTLRRYLKSEGGQSVQLAMTRLPSASQSWVDNVGVWCGELGIPALTSSEVDQQTKDISIDGRPAKSIALQSAESTAKASQIVCWTGDGESWFLKLTGDARLVVESQPAFDQFVQSIRFNTEK